ncbi:hypothetical protein WA158_002360 [Blastocystis sp. Blastoise]
MSVQVRYRFSCDNKIIKRKCALREINFNETATEFLHRCIEWKHEDNNIGYTLYKGDQEVINKDSSVEKIMQMNNDVCVVLDISEESFLEKFPKMKDFYSMKLNSKQTENDTNNTSLATGYTINVEIAHYDNITSKYIPKYYQQFFILFNNNSSPSSSNKNPSEDSQLSPVDNSDKNENTKIEIVKECLKNQESLEIILIKLCMNNNMKTIENEMNLLLQEYSEETIQETLNKIYSMNKIIDYIKNNNLNTYLNNLGFHVNLDKFEEDVKNNIDSLKQQITDYLSKKSPKTIYINELNTRKITIYENFTKYYYYKTFIDFLKKQYGDTIYILYNNNELTPENIDSIKQDQIKELYFSVLNLNKAPDVFCDQKFIIKRSISEDKFFENNRNLSSDEEYSELIKNNINICLYFDLPDVSNHFADISLFQQDYLSTVTEIIIDDRSVNRLEYTCSYKDNTLVIIPSKMCLQVSCYKDELCEFFSLPELYTKLISLQSFSINCEELNMKNQEYLQFFTYLYKKYINDHATPEELQRFSFNGNKLIYDESNLESFEKPEYKFHNTIPHTLADPSSYFSTKENHPSPYGYTPYAPCYLAFDLNTQSPALITPNNLILHTLHEEPSTQNNDKRTSILSLPCALYNGLDTLSLGDYINFSYQSTENEVYFYLPLLKNIELDMNYLDNQTINFFCIRPNDPVHYTSDQDGKKEPHYKGLSVFIEEIGLLRITADYVIVHSIENTLNYIIKDHSYTIHPYRSINLMNRKNTFISTPESEQRVSHIEQAIQHNIPLLIEGPTSCGKTYSVEYVSKRSGIRVIRYNFSQTSSPEDLIGEITLQTNNKHHVLVFKSGAFTEAFIHGGILLLDELSLAPQSIVQSILSFLDSKQIFIDNMEQYEIREMNPYFRIIATQNPAGSEYKRDSLNTDIRGYFRVLNEEVFPPISQKEIQQFIEKKNIGNDEFESQLLQIHNEAVLDTGKRIINKYYTIRDANRAISMMRLRIDYDDIWPIVYNTHYTQGFNRKQLMEQLLQIDQSTRSKNSDGFSDAERDLDYPGEPLDLIVFQYIGKQLDIALNSGSHVIVCASDEYVARKYVYAFLYHRQQIYGNINNNNNDIKLRYSSVYRTLYCSKGITAGNLIGSSKLEEDINSHKYIPQWVDSELLKAADEGDICVIQNIGLMNSNSFERLNNLLEVEYPVLNDSNDKIEPISVRFDERQCNRDLIVDPLFRILATCSVNDLSHFSPALNNRYIHLCISDDMLNEKRCTLYKEPKDYFNNISTSVIENINDENEKNLYINMKQFIDSQFDFFDKKKYYISLDFISEMCELSFEQKEQLIEDYCTSKGKHLSILDNYVPSTRCDKCNELFSSICEHRTTSLIGLKSTGKTHLLLNVLKNTGLIEHHKTIFLTPDTDISQLIGSYTFSSSSSKESISKGAGFKRGPLLEALEKGTILILENAHYLSEELIESIQQFIDPLATSVVYLGKKYDISSNFRLIYVFKSYQQNKIHHDLPSYIQRVYVDLYTQSEIELILHHPLLCRLYRYESISIQQLLIYYEIYQRYCRNVSFDQSNEYMAGIVCLYQPSSFLHMNSIFLIAIATHCFKTHNDNYKPSDIEIEDMKKKIMKFVNYEIGQVTKQNKLTNSIFEVDIPDRINLSTCQWCYDSLFRYYILQSLSTIPPILIGGSESKDQFIDILQNNMDTIELSRSLECDYLIGLSTIYSKKDIQSLYDRIINEMNESNINIHSKDDKYTALKDWIKDIEQCSSEKADTSMIFKPGQITLSIFKEKALLLNHFELLNDNVIPRLNSLFDSYLSGYSFLLHESDRGYQVNLQNCRFIATIEKDNFGGIDLHNYFIYLPCSDYNLSHNDNNNNNKLLEKESLIFKNKFNAVSHLFFNEIDAYFYLKYISGTEKERCELLKTCQCSDDMKELFTYPQTIDYNDENKLLGLTNKIFKEDSNHERFIQKIQRIRDIDSNNNLCLSITTIHMIISLLLVKEIVCSKESNKSNSNSSSNTNSLETENTQDIKKIIDNKELKTDYCSIILEGAPGIGKSDLAIRIFEELNIPYIRQNFSRNIDIGNVFGSLSPSSNDSIQFKDSELSFLLKGKDKCIVMDDKGYYIFDPNDSNIIDKYNNNKKYRLYKGEYTIGILFDELNVASPELLDTISTLITQASKRGSFYIPGDREIELPRLLIVICENPAVISNSRCILPKSIIDKSFYFRNLDFESHELARLSNKIFNKCIKDIYTNEYLNKYNDNNNISKNSNTDIVSYKEYLKSHINSLVSNAINKSKETRINFSFRDILKAKSMIYQSAKISKNPIPIEAALWISIICKYLPEDRESLEKSLGLYLSDIIQYSIYEDKKNNKSYLQLESTFITSIECIDRSSSLLLTNSEMRLLSQLSIAYYSKRGILIYGPSPSGKTHVLTNMAKIMGKKLLIVPLNNESDSSILIGRMERSNLEEEEDNTIDIDNNNNNNNNISDNNKNSILVFREGPLLTAMEKGYWINIDGIQFASGDVLERLNSLLEEQPTLNVIENIINPLLYKVKSNSKDSDSNNECVKYIHPDFRIILTLSSNSIVSIPAPLQSRCILLYAESLSTYKNICELCDLKNNSNKPIGDFIPKSIDNNNNSEIKGLSTRKLIRILDSDESIEDINKLEFFNSLQRNERDRQLKNSEEYNVFTNKFIDMIQKGYSPENEKIFGPLIVECLKHNIHIFSNEDIQIIKNSLRLWIRSILYYPLNYIYNHVYNKFGFDPYILSAHAEEYKFLLRWLRFSDKYYEPIMSIPINKTINTYFSPSNPFDYFEISNEIDRFYFAYVTGKYDSFLSTISFEEFHNVLEALDLKLEEVADENIDLFLKELFDIKKKCEALDDYYQDVTNDNSEAKKLYQLSFEASNFLSSHQNKIKQYMPLFEELDEEIEETQRKYKKICYIRESYIGIGDLLDDNTNNNMLEEVQQLFKQLFSKDNSDLLISTEKPIDILVDYKKIEMPYYKEYIRLSHFMVDINRIELNPNSIFRNIYGILPYINMKIEDIAKNILFITDCIKDIKIIINFFMNIYCGLAQYIILSPQLLEIICVKDIYIHKKVDVEQLRIALLNCCHHGLYGISNTEISDISTLEELFKTLFSTMSIQVQLYDYYPVLILSYPYELLSCIEDPKEELLNCYYVNSIKSLPINYSIQCELDINDKCTINNMNYIRFLHHHHHNMIIPSNDLCIYYGILKNMSNQEIIPFDQYIIDSKLNIRDKYQLLFPAFYTPVSTLLIEILVCSSYSGFAEDAAKSISDSENITINDIFNKIEKLDKTKLNELYDKKNKENEKLQNINNECDELESQYNDEKNKFNKEIDSVLEKLNNKYNLNIDNIKEWYLTQLYHYSWNTFINSINTIRYFIPKELQEKAQELIDSRSSRYFLKEEPISNQFIKVAFITYPSTCRDISIEFQLVNNQVKPAPITFKPHSLKIESKPSSEKTMYSSFIPLPFSTYNVIINRTRIENDVTIEYRYVSLPDLFRHDSFEDEQLLLCNYLLDSLCIIMKESHVLYNISKSFRIEAFSVIEETLLYREQSYSDFSKQTKNTILLYKYDTTNDINDRYDISFDSSSSSSSCYVLPFYFKSDCKSFEIPCYSMDPEPEYKYYIEEELYRINRDINRDELNSYTVFELGDDNEYVKNLRDISIRINNIVKEYDEKYKTKLEIEKELKTIEKDINATNKHLLSSRIFVNKYNIDKRSENYLKYTKSPEFENCINILSLESVPQIIVASENNNNVLHLPTYIYSYNKPILLIPIINPMKYEYICKCNDSSILIENVSSGIKIQFSDEYDIDKKDKLEFTLVLCVQYIDQDNGSKQHKDTVINCIAPVERQNRYFYTKQKCFCECHKDGKSYFSVSDPYLKLMMNGKPYYYRPGTKGDKKVFNTEFIILYDIDIKDPHNEFYIDSNNVIHIFEEPKAEGNRITQETQLEFTCSSLLDNLCNNDIVQYVNAIQQSPYCLFDYEHSDDINKIYTLLKYIVSHKDNYFSTIYYYAEKSLCVFNNIYKLVWFNCKESIYQMNESSPSIENILNRYIKEFKYEKKVIDSNVDSMPKYLNSIGDGGNINLNDIKNNQDKDNIESTVTTISIDADLNAEEQEEDRKQFEIKRDNIEKILQEFRSMSLSNLFKYVKSRGRILDLVQITPTNEDHLKQINIEANNNNKDLIEFILVNYQGILSYYVNSIRKSKKRENQYIPRVNLIFDVNVSHKVNKSRLRSTIGCLLLLICDCLGIPTSLYCTGGRLQAFKLIPTKDNLYEKISIIYDLEKVKKIPSTPLDLFAFEQPSKDLLSQSFFILSDGYSEQLLTDLPEITSFFTTNLQHLFLFHIQSDGLIQDESLPEVLLNEMNDQLKKNFKENMMNVSNIASLRSQPLSDSLLNMFYSSELLESNKDILEVVYPSQNSVNSKEIDLLSILSIPLQDIKDDKISHLLELDKHNDIPYIVSLSQKTGETIILPDVSQKDLENIPNGGNKLILNQMSSIISKELLYDSMNNSIIPPNKATCWIASVTGTSIHLRNYINLLITGYGNGKYFKKRLGGKIRAYSISIIIDCKCSSFNILSIRHSIHTILLFIRCLSELSVSAVDIWIAKDKCYCIGTGLQSYEIWTYTILSSLFQHFSSPTPSTCIDQVIKQATSVCNSRPYSSMEFVFTDGISCEIARKEIKNVIISSETSFIGIGIGYSIVDYENIFPSFIWCSDIHQLPTALENMHTPTTNPNTICNYMCDTIYYENLLKNKFNDVFHPADINKVMDIYGEYQKLRRREKFLNMNSNKNNNGGGKLDDDENGDDSRDDLGRDGAFDQFNVLFVVLYTARPNNIDEQGNQVDPDVTVDNLKKGPVAKLKVKGFKIDIVYDYFDAMDRLRSGKYRSVVITCSPGDGVLGDPEHQGDFNYLNSFIKCLHIFHAHRGGIMFMLENSPLDFEACKFFNYEDGPYHISELCDTEEKIDGRGWIIEKEIDKVDDDKDPGYGEFVPIGRSLFNKECRLPINYGLNKIFEGVTLANINEDELVNCGFKTFAREQNGHAAVMIKDAYQNYGRIVIDTAASKLYSDWSSDGTARWISNAVIWSLNFDDYLNETNESHKIDLSNEQIPDYYTKVDMSSFTDQDIKTEECEKRNIKTPANLVVSIVAFLKGGIHGHSANVSSFLDELINSIEQRRNEIFKKNKVSIRYQVVQYSNYDDRVPLVSSGMSKINDFSYKVSNEKKKTGNGACRGCESDCKDVNGGLIEALKEIDKLPGCTHILFVCGRDPMHNLLPKCKLEYLHRGIDLNKQYHKICETIVKRNVKVHFMPVLSKDILLSANKLREVISNNVFDGRRVEGKDYIFDEDYIVESRDNNFDKQLFEQMKNKFDQILLDEFTKSLQSM